MNLNSYEQHGNMLTLLYGKSYRNNYRIVAYTSRGCWKWPFSFCIFQTMDWLPHLSPPQTSHRATLRVIVMRTEAETTDIMQMAFLSFPSTIKINWSYLVFILEKPARGNLFMRTMISHAQTWKIIKKSIFPFLQNKKRPK